MINPTRKAPKGAAKKVRRKRPFEGTISWAIEEHARLRREKRLNKIRRAEVAVRSRLHIDNVSDLDFLVRLARKAP